MTIHIYQVVVAAVSAYMIFSGAKNFIRGKRGQTFLKFFVRLIVWGGMAVIALFPDLSNFFASFIGMKGNINAVILTAFLLIFLLIFKLLSAIERLEQNISELTRKESLKSLNGVDKTKRE